MHSDTWRRDTWTVIKAHRDGSATVKGGINNRTVRLPADYLTEHAHLAYVTTIHGAQGRTVDHALTVFDETTDRASLYVAATRGRHSNTIHAVGVDRDQVADLLIEAIARHQPETWEAIEADAQRVVVADRHSQQAALRDALRRRAQAIQTLDPSGVPDAPLQPASRGAVGR